MVEANLGRTLLETEASTQRRPVRIMPWQWLPLILLATEVAFQRLSPFANIFPGPSFCLDVMS
jgi:hypothetical protein